MHETLGDGYILDPVGGQRVYADEDPPARSATQMRHEEANAFQEEIANVIRDAGITLNPENETVQQMTQLNQAINQKIAVVQTAVDDLTTDDIEDASLLPGTTLTEVLNQLNSDFIENKSSVPGSSVTFALDSLLNQLSGLKASDVENDSSVAGADVALALNTLNTGFTINNSLFGLLGNSVPFVTNLSYNPNTTFPERITFNSGTYHFYIANLQKIVSVNAGTYGKKFINDTHDDYQDYTVGNNNGGVISTATIGLGNWLHIWACYAVGKVVDYIANEDINNPAEVQSAYASAHSVNINDVGYVFIGSVQTVYISAGGPTFRIKPFDFLNNECRWRETRTTAANAITTVSPGELFDFDENWEVSGKDIYGQMSPNSNEGGNRTDIRLISLLDVRVWDSSTETDLFYYYYLEGDWRNPHRITLERPTASEEQFTKIYLHLNDIIANDNKINMEVGNVSNQALTHSHTLGYIDLGVGKIGSYT